MDPAPRRRPPQAGAHRGALDGDIGIAGPSEAERRTVIGVTGRYRPETARRLAVPLRELDGYLYDRFGAGLLATLGRLHGPLATGLPNGPTGIPAANRS
ncbi:hypothetical protein [Streptomyces turgidiscabies]|uniref:Uncharacterized protein n=1 Tax=Streptomyces turgidiscabies TaxID=85558 RepID=A0ABU0RMT8_9ACTN|nr:hypothetical protein [Streptomyces turgidiscabies]MDQ0933309.1 hypothetical protein [Streptomyces turgidiscabies]